MKLHILASEEKRSRLAAAVAAGTIGSTDEVWRGDAGDLVVGDLPQNEDADGYVFAGTVGEYLV